MRKVLGQKFFDRPALNIAGSLLGKYLCRRFGSRTSCALITEVEAYVGPNDKASHAFRGKTKRNEPMWGEAGIWYVYLCYGVHWMLNIVTGPKNFPAAVLIRGVCIEKDEKLFTSFSNGRRRSPKLRPFRSSDASETVPKRPLKSVKNSHLFLVGPGKLTKFLKIDKRFNGKSADKRTGLWIEDRGVRINGANIRRAPRIGVDYAKEWKDKPYRMLFKQF